MAILAISRTRSSPRTSFTVLRCCRDIISNACDDAEEEADEVAVAELLLLRMPFPFTSEEEGDVEADVVVEAGLEGVEDGVIVVLVTTKCLSAAAAMMGL